jgi:hypothetical protein
MICRTPSSEIVEMKKPASAGFFVPRAKAFTRPLQERGLPAKASLATPQITGIPAPL